MPERIRSLGDAVKVAYFKMRGDLITSHNERVSQEVEEESDLIRDMTRGHPSIECAECGEEVAWGSVRIHRRGGQGGCRESRLNFSDSE